jgi:arginine decarboxylase
MKPTIDQEDSQIVVLDEDLGFMVHTSTSPAFRETLIRIGREIRRRDRGDWWLGVWQPEEVIEPLSHNTIDVRDAPDELLRTDPGCRTRKRGARWHGFADLTDDDDCMLDPITVTVLRPGVAPDGALAEDGIPARRT